MHRIVFDSFSVVAPPGWDDYTDSAETDDPPFTLARDDGVGALQFSIGLYSRGRVPDPSPTDLWEMVESFGRTRELGAAREAVLESSPLRLAAASFDIGEDFLRVWYVSNGRDFGMITYVCEAGREGLELGECESIVRSIEFGRTTSPP